MAAVKPEAGKAAVGEEATVHRIRITLTSRSVSAGLYCTVFYFSVLYFSVIYSIVLHSIFLNFCLLHFTVYCILLFRT